MPEFERLKQLSIAPPVAPMVPYTAEYHGRALSDHYHWLKDQGYPDVNDAPVLDYFGFVIIYRL